MGVFCKPSRSGSSPSNSSCCRTRPANLFSAPSSIFASGRCGSKSSSLFILRKSHAPTMRGQTAPAQASNIARQQSSRLAPQSYILFSDASRHCHGRTFLHGTCQLAGIEAGRRRRGLATDHPRADGESSRAGAGGLHALFREQTRSSHWKRRIAFPEIVTAGGAGATIRRSLFSQDPVLRFLPRLLPRPRVSPDGGEAECADL